MPRITPAKPATHKPAHKAVAHKTIASATEPRKAKKHEPRELNDTTFGEAYELFRTEQRHAGSDGNFPPFSELGLNDRLHLRMAANDALAATEETGISDFQRAVRTVLTGE